MGGDMVETLEAGGDIPLKPDEILRQSFALAVASHDRGDLAEAEQLYRAILGVQPNHPDALHGLGVLAHQVQRDDLAAQFISMALGLRREAVFHNNLALVFLAQNRPHEAMAEVFKALELRADYPQAYNALGNIQDRLGLKEEAIASYRRAIDSAPNYADAMSNLGKVLKDRKELIESRLWFENALALDPECVEALNNLGVLCRERKDYDEALEHLSKAIELSPANAETYVNRGQVWLAKEELQPAEADFRCALALKPDFAAAHCGLGAVCFKGRRAAESIEHFDRALEIDEGCPEALTGAGAAHLKLEHFDQARTYLDRAVAHEAPEVRAQAHFLLGTDLLLKGQLDEGIECFDLAIGYDPDHCDARSNRGLAMQNKGDLRNALRGYDDVLQRDERHVAALSNRLMTMHYLDNITNADMLASAQRFGRLHDHPPSDEAARRSRDLDSERRLKIGYVSGDFNGHPVAMFLLKTLAAHDRNAFDITCYSNDTKVDFFTEKLKSHASAWREINGVSDSEAAEMIADDEIDILVDLAGHTNKNRIVLFGRKPAPIQVEWLGYFGTSGLKSMDYIILDPVSAPEGHDRWYVENVVRLPYGRFCYTSPPFEFPVGEPPCLRKGYVTFGSFNNISKVGEGVVALWSRLLHEVAGSRLLLKSKSLAAASVCKSLEAAFAGHGIGAERLEFRGESPHHIALQQYADLDIALDPFPFGGATTSCEAFWMGVPVLTLPGERLASRQTLAFLHGMGMDELAADSPDDFIARAVALASDKARLADYRRRMRPALDNAAFSDGPKFTRTLEAAYRTMWRRHVAGEPPAAFAVEPISV
jgi:predicted O-linked N-acetylglucosamine transferase (SPINDLY family)